MSDPFPARYPDGTVRLRNPNIELMDQDILYHLALGSGSHDLVEMFGDVKVYLLLLPIGDISVLVFLVKLVLSSFCKVTRVLPIHYSNIHTFIIHSHVFILSQILNVS